MRLGVPREIKNNEFRVAITPAGVVEAVAHGHEVLIEHGAGLGSQLTDAEYEAAGARIITTAEEVWRNSDVLLKVKEPIESEYQFFRPDLVLFTYLHLAADEPLTKALVSSGITAIAYETVELSDGSLPLLAPMSEIAGRLAPQVGADALLRASGGRGVLLGGASGVASAEVVVIGGGVSGVNAATIALGMQGKVKILDTNVAKLRTIDAHFQGRIDTIVSNTFEIERACLSADLVIGAVLVPGARAPRLVSDDLVSGMKSGAVLVDIAIDQGGCFESSRPTTHEDPTYPVADTLFYCVANMPGAVPHTSTFALTNVTLPYAISLLDKGWQAATTNDPAFARGINVAKGSIVNEGVGQAFPHLPQGS